MKAVILAAGKGNRLLPITEYIPKTLVEINGTPIIDRVFQSLPDEIDEVVIVVDYLKDKILSHVGDAFYNRPVRYAYQGEIRGTFGALLSAKDFLESEERFLLLNGDDMHDKEELQEYLKHPRAFGIQKMIMPNYYSMHISSDSFVDSFREQTEVEKETGAYIGTGAYVIDSHIFDHPGVQIADGEYGLPQTLLEQKLLYPLKAVVTTKWLPVNRLSDIERAERSLRIIESSL